LLYLLDANVLIRAHEDYYGLEQVPQFWQWLSGMAEAGQIKMPLEIHDEIAVANGPLPNWICNATTKKALILDEEVDQDLFDQVLSCYGANLSDSDLEKIGRDPFLIAYALSAPDRIVVTKEVSKPSRQGSNRHIPDVCNDLRIKWMPDFECFRALGFTTR
jgi:hypothetical protein